MKKMSFQMKILMAVVLACVICGAISIGVAFHYNEAEFHHGVIEKSRLIHERLNVAAQYVAGQGGLTPMIREYRQKYQSSNQLTEDDKKVILQQVPIYAAMKIGSKDSEKDHYRFRVFSDEPRNPDNRATAQETEIFRKFQENPQLAEQISDDGEKIIVFRPVRLSKDRGCLTCHGEPQTSPWGNGKDILGYRMEDWKDGKLHGVFAIENDLNAIRKADSAGQTLSPGAMLSLFIIFGSLGALVCAFLMVRAPLQSLKGVTTILARTGDQVTHASGQIATTSRDLSQATSEQASSLQQTATSLEEISSMVEKSSENANLTADTSVQSQRKASEGREAIQQMVQSIEDIRGSNDAIMTQVEASNRKMNEIVQVIQEIDAKTKVINEIVFQTKLLSFNASVEAARAGEHGKGFAVVAEEVGNLAQMSGNAAKEITAMLASSVQKVEAIVNETKTTVEELVVEGQGKVEKGLGLAQHCSVFFEEIVSNVSKVSSLAQDISQAGREQSQGVLEINKAMAQLDAVTQKNSSVSEESAAAAEDLSRQAETLKHAVGQLSTIIEGTADHLAAPSAAPRSRPQRPTPERKLKIVESSGSSETIPSGDDDGFKES